MSREISRHGGRPAYRAHDADDHAWESALRPKRCLLALHRKLRDIVARKLIRDWFKRFVLSTTTGPSSDVKCKEGCPEPKVNTALPSCL